MSTAASITVRVLLAIRHRPRRKTVVTPATVTTRTDPALVKSLAWALRYQRMLDESLYASISEVAAAEEIGPRYLGPLLRLTRLSWGTVTMILNGKRKPGRLVHDGLAWVGARRLYR